MLYFAYGSNMDFSRIRGRCPNAKATRNAYLKDYTICFPRFSKGLQCGVAGYEYLVGSKLWGVVYEIPLNEEPALDTAEGVQVGAYRRQDVTVYWEELGKENPIPVVTYEAIPQEGRPFLPSATYKGFIVNGAVTHEFERLAPEYLSMLRGIQTL